MCHLQLAASSIINSPTAGLPFFTVMLLPVTRTNPSPQSLLPGRGQRVDSAPERDNSGCVLEATSGYGWYSLAASPSPPGRSSGRACNWPGGEGLMARLGW